MYNIFLALPTLLALVSALPATELISARSADVYRMYTGNGSPSAGWPAESAWVSTFDAMFAANRPHMLNSCGWMNVPNTSAAEADQIKAAIIAQAAATKIDARYILAIMMQESGGCVRVHTTNFGVRNPGLFQDHDGTHTCNEGRVLTPCPKVQIDGMVADGVSGTTKGPGLKQLHAQAGGSGAQAYYKAARMYNSGSIAASGDLGQGIATHCYAADVANRLTGWVGAAHGCHLDG